MFGKENIVIELENKITNYDDLITEITKYFEKQGTDCKVIERSSIPMVEVNGIKYSAIQNSKLGAFVGVQQIVLKPCKKF